jgi:hypothetical protein
MGWKGTMRSLAAASRSMDREAERGRKQRERMQQAQQAEFEVGQFESYIELISSIHKDCSEAINWVKIKSTPPPIEPKRETIHEAKAQSRLDNFKPNVFNRMLKSEDKKRELLAKAIDQARRKDEMEYNTAVDNYKKEHCDWNDTTEFATRILSGDPKAYKEAIEEIGPFAEITGLGKQVKFNTEIGFIIEANLYVNDEDIIPSEIKTQLKSGKLSTKKMPQARFNELYQDHVCSCILRTAREIYAMLPLKMVIVNAIKHILNTKTGHKEDQAIISVAIPRETLNEINFNAIDPSDAMSNFVNHMSFKKTQGFLPVEKLKASDFRNSQ